MNSLHKPLCTFCDRCPTFAPAFGVRGIPPLYGASVGRQVTRPMRDSRIIEFLHVVGRLLLLLSVCFLPVFHCHALSDSSLLNITFEQNLGAQLSLTLAFRDEDDRQIQLQDYFEQKPVILVLGYYECPMLCSLVSDALVESLGDLKWSIGKEFKLIYVSINPNEKPALSAAKKRSFLRRYGRPNAAQGCHFLTGDEASINAVADKVGFKYAYDPVSRQFAHPSGFVVLTPDGKVSRYFFGVAYSAKEISTALQTASTKRLGARIQQLVLLCFHYNPLTGKYSATILTVLRGLSAMTLAALGWLIFRLTRKRASHLVANFDAGEPRREAPTLPL